MCADGIGDHPAALHRFDLHRPAILGVLAIQHEFRGCNAEGGAGDGIGKPVHILIEPNVGSRTCHPIANGTGCVDEPLLFL
jgi:hypothetical protein